MQRLLRGLLNGSSFIKTIYYLIVTLSMFFSASYIESFAVKTLNPARVSRLVLHSTVPKPSTSSSTIRNFTTIQPNTVSAVNERAANAVLTGKTGAFIRQWPVVHPAATHFKRALRSIRSVQMDTSIKNVRNAQRKYCAQQMDALMKGLTVPITNILQLYQKNFKDLHPYEATVANLTLVARSKAGNPDLQVRPIKSN